MNRLYTREPRGMPRKCACYRPRCNTACIDPVAGRPSSRFTSSRTAKNNPLPVTVTGPSIRGTERPYQPFRALERDQRRGELMRATPGFIG